MSGPDRVADAELRDPDEFVPCPRHGTRCYPEFRDDLAKRIEVAVGLASGAIRETGPDGVRELRDRILAIIEDHDAERDERVALMVQGLVDLFAEHLDPEDSDA